MKNLLCKDEKTDPWHKVLQALLGVNPEQRVRVIPKHNSMCFVGQTKPNNTNSHCHWERTGCQAGPL